ncbi:hypothetical protein [Nocardia sp. NPDC060249]|uniref:hypothetical protein n=1 Tax=Nocardia sp. NPDC060249 TaxID=3347082 RepID=UPI003665406B
MTAPSHLLAEHRLELTLDYGQFILHGGEGEEDVELALLEAAHADRPSAGDGHTVVVLSPHQNNFDMPIHIQVWDRRPVDEGEWQHVSEARLHIGEHGLTISSPVDGWADAPVPPGDYLAEIAGTGFVNYGWPGDTTPGDHWRIRLWPDDGTAVRPARQWDMPGYGIPANSEAPPTEPTPSPTEPEPDRQRELRAEAEARARAEWGGDPIPAFADTYHGRELAGYDRALAESIAAMSATQRRRLAEYCAQRAYALAGLSDRDWVRPALDALRSGAPLPEPFHDNDAAFARLDRDQYGPDEASFRSSIVWERPAPPAPARNPYDRGNISRPHFALNTVFHARHADPLQGALSAITEAAITEAAITFGPHVESLFTDIRGEFDLPPRS